MPLYAYVCKKCEHEETLFLKMSDLKAMDCPKCQEKEAFDRVFTGVVYGQLKDTKTPCMGRKRKK